ncbi:phosphate ABC transporter permease subunit PstC [Propionibacteriaceae bacterium G57]|uniref:phosphate ABC transporter permease subunit PstC n=1 Tax=Aestuariimicrobium sp. G57 TaxID=3418485 RepID=UPI003DA6F6C1
MTTSEAQEDEVRTTAAPSDIPPGADIDPSVSPVPADHHVVPKEINITKVDVPEPSKAPDKVFSGATLFTGILLVTLVGAIFIFLLLTAIGPLSRNEVNFLTSNQWLVNDNQLAFGIAGMLWTTVISSLIAMVLAVPVAIGVALLITHYAPPTLGRIVGFLVDLLAAVPSVVYGLWGIRVFAPWLQPISDAISSSFLGKLGFFAPGLQSPGTVFAVSLVLAIMILPIITSLSRDVFEQTPRDNIEAAWALGATKWEMVKTAVIPYGRSGVVAASMLGLGRALGETIAVMLILSTVTEFSFSIFSGGETFASKIARGAPEFDSPTKTGAFIAAGLVLFVLTFAVNAVARTVASGGKAKS